MWTWGRLDAAGGFWIWKRCVGYFEFRCLGWCLTVVGVPMGECVN